MLTGQAQYALIGGDSDAYRLDTVFFKWWRQCCLQVRHSMLSVVETVLLTSKTQYALSGGDSDAYRLDTVCFLWWRQ